jgi:hypothetical protein
MEPLEAHVLLHRKALLLGPLILRDVDILGKDPLYDKLIAPESRVMTVWPTDSTTI